MLDLKYNYDILFFEVINNVTSMLKKCFIYFKDCFYSKSSHTFLLHILVEQCPC